MGPQLSFTGGDNRIDGWGYDAAGNLLKDAAHSYTYDAEGRVSEVDNASTPTYTYDAEGRRVSKTANGATLYYLLDLAGHPVMTLNASGGWVRGEIYAGGRYLATDSASQLYFVHSDWLGTERARTLRVDVEPTTLE